MRADDHDRPLDPEPGGSARARPRAAARGFDRLVRAGRARRASPRRLALGVLIAVAVAWGGFEGGRLGLRQLAFWVAAQPEHQIPFDAIALEPPPPPFIRRGAEAILSDVRRRGGYPETVSVLAVDVDRLRADLERSPWVEAVGAIRRSHRRLAVEVAYRQPTALMAWPSGIPNEDWCVLVDRRGVEMPADDSFVWAKKQPDYIPQGGRSLIQIRDFGPNLPDRIGQPWAPKDPKIGPGLVRQAIDLANFLQDHRSDGLSSALGALGIPRIELDRSKTRFFLRFNRHDLVFWGPGPGAERADEPRTSEKWAILERYVAEHGGERYVAEHGGLGLGQGRYLVLEHAGASVRSFPGRPRPTPASEAKRP